MLSRSGARSRAARATSRASANRPVSRRVRATNSRAVTAVFVSRAPSTAAQASNAALPGAAKSAKKGPLARLIATAGSPCSSAARKRVTSLAGGCRRMTRSPSDTRASGPRTRRSWVSACRSDWRARSGSACAHGKSTRCWRDASCRGASVRYARSASGFPGPRRASASGRCETVSAGVPKRRRERGGCTNVLAHSGRVRHEEDCALVREADDGRPLTMEVGRVLLGFADPGHWGGPRIIPDRSQDLATAIVPTVSSAGNPCPTRFSGDPDPAGMAGSPAGASAVPHQYEWLRQEA